MKGSKQTNSKKKWNKPTLKAELSVAETYGNNNPAANPTDGGGTTYS